MSADINNGTFKIIEICQQDLIAYVGIFLYVAQKKIQQKFSLLYITFLR